MNSTLTYKLTTIYTIVLNLCSLCQRIFSLNDTLQLPTNIMMSYYKILHLSLQIWYTVFVFRFHHYHTPISSQTLYLQGIPPWLSTYFLLIFIYLKEQQNALSHSVFFFVTAITRLFNSFSTDFHSFVNRDCTHSDRRELNAVPAITLRVVIIYYSFALY